MSKILGFFCFLQIGSCYVAQAGLELLGSRDPSALAFQVGVTTHTTVPNCFFGFEVGGLFLTCHSKGTIHRIVFGKLCGGTKHWFLLPELLPWVLSPLLFSFLNCSVRLTEFTSGL